MHPTHRTLRRVAALGALIALLSATAPASAKDMTGRFGLGGEITSALRDSGLSAKFWFGELGGQLIAGMDWNNPDPGAGEDSFDLNLGLRILWSAARSENTHFYLAGGVMLHIGDDSGQVVDVLVGAEHFLTDYFAVSGQLGFNLDIQDGIRLSLARASWAAGFHFYF